MSNSEPPLIAPGVNTKIHCKRNLYKSTYKGNAFIAGSDYIVMERNHLGTFILDEEGHSFGPFVDQAGGTFYILGDYFDEQ